MSQCSSGGGFCKKSGCERQNVQPPKDSHTTRGNEMKSITELAVDAGLIRVGEGYTEPHRWGMTEIESFASMIIEQYRNDLLDDSVDLISPDGSEYMYSGFTKGLSGRVRADVWTKPSVERMICIAVANERLGEAK